MAFSELAEDQVYDLAYLKIDPPRVEDSDVFELGEAKIGVKVIELDECLDAVNLGQLIAVSIDDVKYFCKLFF